MPHLWFGIKVFRNLSLFEIVILIFSSFLYCFDFVLDFAAIGGAVLAFL